MSIKGLNRDINRFFRQRDKITLTDWRKMRVFMTDARNGIMQQLRAVDLSEWQVSNLNQILAGINNTIGRFDFQYREQLGISQREMINFTADATDQMAVSAELKQAFQFFVPDELLVTLAPIRNVWTDLFTGDMRRIVTAEVSTGLVTGLTPFKVAQNIHDKFGLDVQQREALTIAKQKIEADFKAGRISEEDAQKLLKPINRKLRSGSKMSFARAQGIAETEILRASSFAQQQRNLEIEEANPDAVKIWLHSGKLNARPGHIDAQNKYRENPIGVTKKYRVRPKVGEPYEWGMFPRDPSFSAANTAFCGCTSIAISKSLVPEATELGVDVG